MKRSVRWWTCAIVSIAVWGSVLTLRAASETPQPDLEIDPASSSSDATPSASDTASSASSTTPLTPLAHQFIEKARERLEAQEQVRLERERARAKADAQRLAVEMAREKAKRQHVQALEQQRQVRLARERKLKLLYNRGLALYQEGSYRQAIELLQRMVMMDPQHPLVKAADRLIARAELKRFQEQVRAQANLPPQAGGALVSELERLLTQKRIELETALKYARASMWDHDYDTAIKLLTGILAQDPDHHDAQQLLEQVQEAKLTRDSARIRRQVELDERSMVHDVLKAQLLPQAQTESVATLRPIAAGTVQEAMAAKLREPITVEFTDVALGDVLDFIADAANLSLVPSPHLALKDQRVSIKVKELPLEQAIKYLTKSLSLAYRIDEDAILIATPEEFSNQPMETRIFFLRSGVGPFALETAAVKPNPLLAMESIKDLVEQTVPQPSDSKLVLDERSGALIATNTADNLRLVERLLSQLDVTPLQVLIEARFIELVMTELEQLGVESILNGNAALDKKGAGDGTQGAGTQINSGSGFKFPTLSREGEALNLTLQGILTGTQFETLLHLLEEKKKSKTLSAPRITTLNNQSATIKVVEEFRYPTRYEVSLVQFDINGDGDFDDAGETEFVNVPQDFQQRDIGILLHVTPSVGKDLRTITLVLVPEVSNFSQFRNLGGGVTVPEFTSSQLTTSVVMEDGQTVVLGGLMKDTTTDDLTKVPVLGDLPLVGGLFRQHEASSTRKNLLIFITAHLLAPRGDTT